MQYPLSGDWNFSVESSSFKPSVNVAFSHLGQLQLFIDGHHKGSLLLGLPVRRRLWLLLDLYGNTDSATFVTTG